MEVTSFQPLDKHQRLKVVDALRGLALFGIILANVPFDHAALTAGTKGLFFFPETDAGLRFIFELFIDKKFITLFSILFGFGFFIQYSRTKENGIQFKPYFVRRMFLLFLIGAMHAYIFWFGDILRYYAIGGIFLLLANHLSSRRIMWLGIFFSIFLTSLVFIANNALGIQVYDYDYSLAYEIYTAETYGRYSTINRTIDPMVNFVQDSPLTLVFTYGCMLLGLWLGKIGFFNNPDHFKGMTRNWILAGVTVGLLGSFGFWALNHGKLEMSLSMIWIVFLIVAGMLVQSLMYIGLFTMLFKKKIGAKLLSPFQTIGRMALTNYLLQTGFYLIFFFHWTGFELYGKLGLSATYLLALLFFASQVAFSRWWLKRYSQGPVEKLWKKLSYFKPRQLPVK